MAVHKLPKNIDKIAALRNTELFRAVSDSVVAEAASRAFTRELKTGEVLFSEQDAATGLYIVADGELRSIRQNTKGREQVLSTEHPGAILAAAPVFNGGNYYTTTIADKPSHVLCIQTHDVHDLCHKHPDLLWSVARIFAHKLRHFSELIETLALRNVDQRVAQHILTVCQQRGSVEGDTCSVDIKMTQSELASRIGSTREVVCRAIAHLEHEGLIQTVGTRTFKIPKLSALAKFAGVQLELGEPLLVSELSSDIA